MRNNLHINHTMWYAVKLEELPENESIPGFFCVIFFFGGGDSYKKIFKSRNVGASLFQLVTYAA